MSTARSERIMMIASIIERGKAKAYIEMLRKKGIGFHMQCVGQGTASSEMMDILGLVSNNKDIVISYAPHRTVEALATDISKDLSSGLGFNGLMMLLTTSAINRLVSELILLQSENGEAKGEVIRARMAGAEQLLDPQLSEEKEIIAILAPDSVRNQIMEEVNKEYGMRSEAKGVVCSVPVDKALKI